MRQVVTVIGGVLIALLIGLVLLGRGLFGQHDSEAISPVEMVRPESEIVEGTARQYSAAQRLDPNPATKQILFGDLHAHTTISFDAFMLNLPVMGGEGAAPPADACDFARHCAALDFWSINDHAANVTPRDWQNTIEAIRNCNAVAGDSENPDLVSFLGWEWTQAGRTPDDHYGHKNVVLKSTRADEIPSRPIAASMGGTASNGPGVLARGIVALGGERFRDLAARWTALSEMDVCVDDAVRALPDDCREIAATPADLFAKLDDWDQEALVIPHGTTWGIYTPPRSTWDKQLVGPMHDPDRQTLIEIYSGHGDGEVYRDWRALDLSADGSLACPEPVSDYMPMCWRAGEIIEQRCLAEGASQDDCAERAREARTNAALAGVSPHVTVPGITSQDLNHSGQCRDCDQPAFKYRPGGSAQYMMALSNFDAGDDAPRRFRFGFIASSDIHSARPGTGYKEQRELSESPPRTRPDDQGVVASFLLGAPEEPIARSRTDAEAREVLSGLQLYESERVRSFLYTGGLVAVHSDGRDRDAIWSALERREVYGTSGPRILLWFDLVRGAVIAPMGSEVTSDRAPVFRVRAAGSLEQAPGCPESTVSALGAKRTENLCAGECYRPTDERRVISHIDVIRILPQKHPGEDIAQLIEDPWMRFDCPPDPDGCVATFEDPTFESLGRDAVYYARVHEEMTPSVNGQPLQCRSDGDDPCASIDWCADSDDECLAGYEHRAWSSPIFVNYSEGS